MPNDAGPGFVAVNGGCRADDRSLIVQTRKYIALK